MDAEMKAKWIEALESGKYKQGRRRLRSRYDEFCCLGVLCHISQGVFWDSGGTAYYRISADAHALPKTLMDDLDVPPVVQGALVEMNDGGCSFAQIAAYIRENL